jgi:hypothetical protein
MEADEFDSRASDEHVSQALGFSHPLVLLMPYDPGAPAPLRMVQHHVWEACESKRSYLDRLRAALTIRTAIAQLGLGGHEAALVAIDILQGLQKLLLSAAVLEQLAWAFLDRDGIGLEDRRFSSPPFHPLPVLVRIDRDSGKPVSVTRAAEISDALGVWTSVSLEQAAKSPEDLEGTSSKDLRASLRMLVLFLLHGNLDQFRATRAGKLDRLEDMGLSLWDTLLTLLRKSPEHRQDDEERFGPAIQQAMWHFLRSKELRPSVAAAPTITPPRPPAAPSGTHLVVRGEIPAGTSDEDRHTLARYEKLRWPLPVGRLLELTEIDATEAKLMAEFPWARSAIDEIASDLRSRRLFGSVNMGMTPTLLVGLPGCGKSRLARRFAEELNAAFHAVSFAGMGDSRAILGTARGWSGGQPSPILGLMVSKSSASPLVLLDEIDKARGDTKNDVAPTSALLNLLEPENARCWYDAYLQTPCDMTKLLFVATANMLSPIPKPLLSRLRVVIVPEPRREDFRTIARGALVDIAREWDLPEQTFESVGDTMPLGAARNAREIRHFARAYLHDWAREALGPGRRH